MSPRPLTRGLVPPTKVVAIIPARAGSKSVPNKNFTPLAGRTLLERALHCADEASLVSQIVVSSDSPLACESALSGGAEFHLRSESAAADSATANDVVRDLIAFLHDGLRLSDDVWLVYLQPTSVFRTSAHVDAIVQQSLDCGLPSVSVQELSLRVQKAVFLSSQGLIQTFFDQGAATANRQDLEVCFLPNGAAYVFTLEQFMERNSIPVQGALPYIMSQADSLDIDAPADWQRAAEFLERNASI